MLVPTFFFHCEQAVVHNHESQIKVTTQIEQRLGALVRPVITDKMLFILLGRKQRHLEQGEEEEKKKETEEKPEEKTEERKK